MLIWGDCVEGCAWYVGLEFRLFPFCEVYRRLVFIQWVEKDDRGERIEFAISWMEGRARRSEVCRR